MAVEKPGNSAAIGQDALDTMFLKARTYSSFQKKDVPDDLLHKLHDTLKFGPTSANCCPARFIFVKSKEAKERLKPHLDEGNRDKTMAAPVTAIIGYDLKFYEHMKKLFPHTDARSWFEGKPEKIKYTAFQNGTLQGAYLIMAARALGLDCGPMSGFNIEGVKKEFFEDTDIVPNFLCNLGYGDASKLHPRSPRFEFDETSKII
jgi:3-hydroxypropanoate dehydrogenase